MSIFDLDNYTDAVSDAVDAVGDAGDLIGGILKSVAPILGSIPGVGTAFAVAVYAAGAIAAKDKITDAMIGTASAAMPPGIPRIAFDGATNIAKDVSEGRSVVNSALDACRQAAAEAGGDRAVDAFDSGVAVMRGEKVDDRLLDQGRAFALQTGGQTAATAYDAGVSIAQGNGAHQVVLDVGREYVNQVGGPAALAAFDTGIAISYGKTLQEAGYVGLQTFVKGNNGIEKVLNFVDQVGWVKSTRTDLRQSLELGLAAEFHHALRSTGIDPYSAVDMALTPYLDAIRGNRALLESPAGELARQLGAEEAIVRAAQALLRNADLDEDLLKKLKDYRPPPVFDFSERNAATNDRYAELGRAMIDSGARWKGRLLSDIRAGNRFTITLNAVEGVERPHIVRRKETHEIDDSWRRGFEIAICICEGATEDGPGQRRVRASLVGNTGRGFDAGQEVQFNRTNPLRIRLKQETTAGPSGTQALAADKLGSNARQSVAEASASGMHQMAASKPRSILIETTLSAVSPGRFHSEGGR